MLSISLVGGGTAWAAINMDVSLSTPLLEYGTGIGQWNRDSNNNMETNLDVTMHGSGLISVGSVTVNMEVALPTQPSGLTLPSTTFNAASGSLDSDPYNTVKITSTPGLGGMAGWPLILRATRSTNSTSTFVGNIPGPITVAVPTSLIVPPLPATQIISVTAQSNGVPITRIARGQTFDVVAELNGSIIATNDPDYIDNYVTLEFWRGNALLQTSPITTSTVNFPATSGTLDLTTPSASSFSTRPRQITADNTELGVTTHLHIRARALDPVTSVPMYSTFKTLEIAPNDELVLSPTSFTVLPTATVAAWSAIGNLTTASWAGASGGTFSLQITDVWHNGVLLPSGERTRVSSYLNVTATGLETSLTPPSPSLAAGTYVFAIEADDSSETKTATFTLIVGPHPAQPSLTFSAAPFTLGQPHTDVPVTITPGAGGNPFNIVSITPSTIAGLTFTLTGNAITISGTPTAAGNHTVDVSANVPTNTAARTFPLTVNVTPPTAVPPAITLAPATLGFVRGAASASHNVAITWTPAGATIANLDLDLTQLPTGLTASDFTGTGNTRSLTISGTTNVTAGTHTVYVTADVTPSGGAATAVERPLTINVTDPAAPNLLASPSTISRNPASLTQIVEISGPAAYGAAVITGLTGPGTTVNATSRTWNGLNIVASGSTVTITGTPAQTLTETFTVAGTLGATPANSVNFTIVATGPTVGEFPVVPAPGLLGNPANWTKDVSGNTITLNIPVTNELIVIFGTGGVLRTQDIQRVLVDVLAPNATLIPYATDTPVRFMIVDGMLRLTMRFTPHNANWANGIVIRNVNILGTGETTGYYTAYTPAQQVPLDGVRHRYEHRRGGGGGCNVLGFAGLMLLLTLPVVLSRKKKR